MSEPEGLMYSVGVRDHVMIAHSFQGEVFGPAQKLHGATFIVDCEFHGASLTPSNILVDIGRAGAMLRGVCGDLSYQNLDDLEMFEGVNTTTEFLARHVFDRMSSAAKTGQLGPGSEGITSIKVTLWESHIAWASYEAAV